MVSVLAPPGVDAAVTTVSVGTNCGIGEKLAVAPVAVR
jgi:hypothetical protein